MTDPRKRFLLKAAGLATLATALLACGKKDEAPAPTAEPGPAPASAAAASPEPLKIAFAYVGPTGDAGWTFAHDTARKAIEAEFGAKIQTTFV